LSAVWRVAARGARAADCAAGDRTSSSWLARGQCKICRQLTQGARRYVEGRNIAIEYRWGHGDSGRLPELASDLISRRVAVIVTPGGVAAALAAKAATTSIPIVFVIGADPVQAGLVVSLNLPGGNVTGIGSMNTGLAAKQLGLLHHAAPRRALRSPGQS
jgi:ABC-type uncharacterized transport system substrate-binding protein